MAIAVATFLIALAIIASEKLHRTNVALLGAAIVVLFVGDFSQEQAIESVDFNTIGLLVGMMILVYLTQQTGVYDYVAIRAGQLSGGRSFALTMSLAGITALLSAFLDNLTTILLVAPITFLLADALDIEAMPLLIIEVIASNIGGTATLIGDPPNIIIAGATGLSFNEFIVNLAPIVIVTFAVVMPLLYLVFRRRLQIEERNRQAVMGLNAAASIRDCAELRRTGPVLVAHRARLLRPPGAARRAGHRRAGRSLGRPAGHQGQPGEGALHDRVDDALLLHRPLRDGRGAGGDRGDRPRRRRGQGPDRRRSHAPSCWGSSGSPRSARRSSTTSPSRRR